MLRIVWLTCLAFMATASYALPDKVTVNVPGEGKYLVWLESANGQTVFLPPMRAQAARWSWTSPH